MTEPIFQVFSPMLMLGLRATLLTLALMASSLVFAAELVLSALILVSIVLVALYLLLGSEGLEDPMGQGVTGEAESA